MGNVSQWLLSNSNHVLAIELRHICYNIRSLSCDRITWNAINGPVTIASIWKSLRSPGPVPPWISIIWNRYSVQKFSVNAWLIFRQRLPTTDRLLRFGCAVDTKCLLCNIAAESHEHLFCNCSFTRSILDDWDIKLYNTWPDFLAGDVIRGNPSSIKRQVTYLFLNAALHAIWAERNNRRHAGQGISKEFILQGIKLRVRNKLFSCPHFQTRARRDNTLTSLLF